jgi:hypothetical protein
MLCPDVPGRISVDEKSGGCGRSMGVTRPLSPWNWVRRAERHGSRDGKSRFLKQERPEVLLQARRRGPTEPQPPELVREIEEET